MSNILNWNPVLQKLCPRDFSLIKNMNFSPSPSQKRPAPMDNFVKHSDRWDQESTRQNEKLITNLKSFKSWVITNLKNFKCTTTSSLTVNMAKTFMYTLAGCLGHCVQTVYSDRYYFLTEFGNCNRHKCHFGNSFPSVVLITSAAESNSFQTFLILALNFENI